jgi:outer membrane protein OmpA-like peptidoglycan-associated protein
MRVGLSWTAAAFAALACGCASPGNDDLARAQAEYEAAAADADVARLAPNQLEQAREALGRAQAALRDDAGDEEVEHLAYVASRRVEIARAAADRREHLRDAEVAAAAERRAARLATELAAALEALPAREDERGVVVTLDDVLFDPGRAALRADAFGDLARVADFLEVHPDLGVRIEGHADPAETGRDAAELSLARAQAVESYLAAQGIDPARMHVRGYGAAEPAAPVTAPGGRERNRRVEIVVVE